MDDRDCLSDSHRDYLIRYIEYELRRQEKVSKTFPAGAIRACSHCLNSLNRPNESASDSIAASPSESMLEPLSARLRAVWIDCWASGRLTARLLAEERRRSHDPCHCSIEQRYRREQRRAATLFKRIASFSNVTHRMSAGVDSNRYPNASISFA
jgi:hypothetical protein